ncbi:MAG TPA: hypothetical protein VIG50_04195 [Vicinamibacteria bacterium]|jgi:hypothetical protein
MPVKVLCAGCSKEEREQAEVDVRKALAGRGDTGDWMVSLVKLADRWSITLDAPAARVRGMTVVAPQGRLADSIREALRQTPAAAGGAVAPAAPAAAPRPAAPPGGPNRCDKCGGAFVVVYEARPGESLESAPVACPHCWFVNRVLIDAEAAFTRDYRAEKA